MPKPPKTSNNKKLPVYERDTQKKGYSILEPDFTAENEAIAKAREEQAQWSKEVELHAKEVEKMLKKEKKKKENPSLLNNTGNTTNKHVNLLQKMMLAILLLWKSLQKRTLH